MRASAASSCVVTVANWREINEAISRCRRSTDSVACLTALFERIWDGHVAAALGEEHERRGRIDDAKRWFTEATRSDRGLPILALQRNVG